MLFESQKCEPLPAKNHNPMLLIKQEIGAKQAKATKGQHFAIFTALFFVCVGGGAHACVHVCVCV